MTNQDQISTRTISSLPNELLVAIVAAGQDCGTDFPPRAFKSEWILSQVSQRFRDVILGAPALWTLIQADLYDLRAVETLMLYLERSGAHKISITLRSLSRYSEGPLTECLTQILPHVERLWRLAITIGAAGVDALAPFRDVEAPHLQHLDLEVIADYPIDECIEIFSAGAPRLSFLKMDGLMLQMPPWMASLTHLEALEHWVSEYSNLLAAMTAQCPLLVHLHLDILWEFEEASRFHIPSLKFLQISVPDSEDEFFLEAIVDLFDTPALEEFIIYGTHGDQIFTLFNLTSLPHSITPSPTQSLLPPLALFPALSSLTLVNQCLTHNLVKDLLGPSSQPWPRLETVTLCPKKDIFDAVWDAVKDAVHSKSQRREPFPRLRFFRTLASLEAWQGDGPDVEMFFASNASQPPHLFSFLRASLRLPFSRLQSLADTHNTQRARYYPLYNESVTGDFRHRGGTGPDGSATAVGLIESPEGPRAPPCASMNKGEVGGDEEDAGDIGPVPTGQDWACNRTYYLILTWTVKS
ncbi:hypothetical protein B0H14DRAFT_2587879 [Mycena olivaceomarginata]|nr:hypothetical protein B0H14DRAFT_2587879 [Mycena olivaceomarginata]